MEEIRPNYIEVKLSISMKMIGEKNVENMTFFSPALLKQQETELLFCTFWALCGMIRVVIILMIAMLFGDIISM